MHPASTGEQQSGRKWFRTYGQPGDDSGITVGSAVGRLREPGPPSRLVIVNQLGRSGGRRLAHHIRDIRRQGLHIGGYAVRYTYFEPGGTLETLRKAGPRDLRQPTSQTARPGGGRSRMIKLPPSTK